MVPFLFKRFGLKLPPPPPPQAENHDYAAAYIYLSIILLNISTSVMLIWKVCIDNIVEHSRFPFIYACPCVTTKTVMKCLRLLSLFDMPRYIHSDKGIAFSRTTRECSSGTVWWYHEALHSICSLLLCTSTNCTPTWMFL